ncbi:MAG: hypothetical protein ACRCY8_07895 [Dermatophilaceae bacterium]
MAADPTDLLPVGLLREIQDHAPGIALVGSYARDYWVHGIAGLPVVARTLDVDVTVLVASMDEYRQRLRALDGPTGTGMLFRVSGYDVDVIPYGDVATDEGIIEPVPGVTLDVTGMRESIDTAVEIMRDDVLIRIPRLSSIIGLKIVAWAYRHDSTTKDARDLGPLLTATHHGPTGDELWTDDDACDRWDYDPVLVGPYRSGRELLRLWTTRSCQQVLGLLAEDHRAELATQIARFDRTSAAVRGEQLAAFAVGLGGR